MQKKYFVCCLFLLALLSGCATQVEPPVDHPIYQSKLWKHRKVNLANKTSWDIQGAVSIQSRGKTQMASFSWKQMRQYYAINVYGPLNLGNINLQGRPGSVTLSKSTGGYWSASTAESLMRQQLGWYLPVSSLYFWIRALPAPGFKAEQQQDEYGHLVLLRQEGWSIQFAAFQSLGNVDLPRKIVMDNPSLHVKLVITDWNLHDD